jgi:uncharacterized protein GlcG (DUF336 family)
MKKAYTARTMNRPSGEFAAAVNNNPTAGALFLSNIVPVQGALPIKVGNDTIGAIGVSGAPGGDKDEACAKAGVDKNSSSPSNQARASPVLHHRSSISDSHAAKAA